MITQLTYVIESDGEGNYLISLNEDSKLALPTPIADELSSFAVSVNTAHLKLYTDSTAANHLVGELICRKLQSLLDTVWDLKLLGIPSINFIGALRKVADVFKCRNILIYTKGANSTPEQASETWLSNISAAAKSKFTFLGVANQDGTGFSVITTEVAWASDWLVKYGIQVTTTNVKTLRYDLDLRMKQWYRNDQFRSRLLAQAKQVIDEFVVSCNFNMYIPGYLVIPAYHVLRYKKATDLLNEKFTPEFIMTLPLMYTPASVADGNEKFWTILFPVCGHVTKNTLRKKLC
jgi:hypothetical protein